MTIKAELDSNRDYVVGEYRKGRGTSSLGREFECNAATVYLRLKAWGEVDATRSRTTSYGDPSFDPKIVELHAAGMSSYRIAKEIGCSKPTVLRRGSALGLDFSAKSKLKSPVRLKDRVDEVLEMAESGLSARQIGLTLGYGPNHVVDLLREHGVEVTRNTYDVDLTYFDEIDTEEKAYLLGFWYADGNVMEDKIRLQITDLEIAEFAREAMKFTGPIAELPPTAQGRKTQYLLAICRKELVRALIAKGCPPNKSLILTFPGPDIVPPRLVRHFVRGYFDGDGSVGCFGKKKVWTVQIVGTREYLEGIRDESGVAGYWSQRHPDRMNNNWTWAIRKKADTGKFLDWIYEDASCYLGRKHDLYLRMKAETTF